MKHIRLYIAGFSMLLGLAGFVLAPVAALAATPQQTVCTTLGSSSDCSQTPSNGVSLDGTIAAVINILSVVVGITAVIMIIVAGMRFITANGDSNSISSARSSIIYAIVGLTLVAAAQAIVKFVLNKVT